MRNIHDDDDAHDVGFALDRKYLLPAPTMTRRTALGMLGAGAAGVALFARPATAGAATTASLTKTPEETAGPYPADGSNGPDVLDDNGIVRTAIRRSFGSASGVADGWNVHIVLKVLHAATSKPYNHAAIYLWHCDRLGRYSLYSQGITGENYLRGIQTVDATGTVTFQSIFPACYSGRWPHIHYEVYPTQHDARNATNRLLTSQIALPKAACDYVYAKSGYESSAANIKNVSLDTDMVFRDGYAQELATVNSNSTRIALTVAI